MKLSDSFTIPSDVMARTLGEETVILDLASGTYFGLDPVGSRVWALMIEGKTIAEICDVLLSEYDVAREDIEIDTKSLAQELSDRALIEVRPPTEER